MFNGVSGLQEQGTLAIPCFCLHRGNNNTLSQVLWLKRLPF